MKTIIIDLLGSDLGEAVLLEGVRRSDKGYKYLLVGSKELIDKTLFDSGLTYEAVDTDNYITNEENPLRVLKDKTASLSVCFERLKSDDAVGLISAGATGALFVGTAMKLGLKKGLLSPVLSCMLPRFDGEYFCLADCGANVNPTAEDSVKFAQLAVLYVRAFKRISEPKVYLLNLGKESGKGNAFSKSAYKALSDSGLNFCGNVEADKVFYSDADVVVCDGFAGNVLIKCAEVVAMGVKNIAKNTFCNADEYALFASKVDSLFDYNELAGATLLGYEKPIIKLHGKANAETVKNGVDQLIRTVEGDFSEVFGQLQL